MNVNPDRLPSGYFESTPKEYFYSGMRNVANSRTVMGIENVANTISYAEEEYDAIDSLSSKWQSLPVQERLKIRPIPLFVKVMDVAWKISFVTIVGWIVISFFVD